MPQLITPEWPTPKNVVAAMTTRLGGVSETPFDSLNLGYATADSRACVAENERRVAERLGVSPASIRWVYQVHGADVHHAEALPANDPLGATALQGDAIVCHTPGLVCGIKVADCMPVLFANQRGSAVAAAHAGWRGLLGGVLERTVAQMQCNPDEVVTWLGPCIGPKAFEVGEEVRRAFIDCDAGAAQFFTPTGAPGKFLCDLYALARQRLNTVGVTQITVSGRCTVSEPEFFYSHRRDKITGRMAALVFLRA
jgi:polyphenol oxidase